MALKLKPKYRPPKYVCRECNETKPAYDFPKHKKTKTGYSSICKACIYKTNEAAINSGKFANEYGCTTKQNKKAVLAAWVSSMGAKRYEDVRFARTFRLRDLSSV